MHCHVRMRAHGKNLVLTAPELLNPHVYSLLTLYHVVLKLGQRLHELTEYSYTGAILQGVADKIIDFFRMEHVMHDDATVEPPLLLQG